MTISRRVEITRGRTPALVVLAIVGIWVLAASNAKAALQPGCSQSGTTVTCPYAQQGQTASFTVPTGVTSLRVYAVGGTGGGYVPLVGPRPFPGGPGAIVAGNVSVSPGNALAIQVAGDGNSTGPGAGGGGAGCSGGGGASRVSTSSGPLVVAAGGGGQGCYGSGPLGIGYFGILFPGNGGAAGADGAAAGYGNAGGGKGGTSTAGGAGGAGGTGIVNGKSGAAGFAGAGGAGGNGTSGAGVAGGGGGGGLYGGGGGGQGASEMVNGSPTTDPGGGGGGGSSLVPPGGTFGLVSVAYAGATPNPLPMVVLSYDAPPSASTPPPGTILPPGSTGSTTIPQAAARVTLTGVSQSHARWRRGNALPRIAAIARVRNPPVGTTFRFTLSGPAAVRFAFTQPRPGRRVGDRCVARTARNRRKRPCSRTVTAGSLSFSAGAGRYAVRFQGRVSRSKKLKPGRYTLIITATNTAGSTNAKLSFTIVS